jgi:hypothetical protein
VQILPWDSQFFGVRIARANVVRADDLVSTIAAAREHDVECLYVVVPAARADAVGEAIRAGGVLTALRLDLEHRGDAATTRPSGVRRATAKDSARVTELSAALARFSRFAQDERFPVERIEEMYRIWAATRSARRALTSASPIRPTEADRIIALPHALPETASATARVVVRLIRDNQNRLSPAR